MITLLGSALGFFTSFLPKLADMWQTKIDNAHELAIMDKQLEQQVALGELALRRSHVEADTAEFKAVHQHDSATRKYAAEWTSTLSASVRPVISYLFMGLFIFVEVSAYLILINKGVQAGDAAAIIWDHEIQSLFAAIMSFWFGGREIRKWGGKQ